MFDTPRFLRDRFIDTSQLMATLGAYRLPAPNAEAARKWFQRGSVPSDWFPVLVCAAELDEGQPVRLAQYLVAGETGVAA